jgi:ABC-type antimicrobial peptide transport system permease subunit
MNSSTTSGIGFVGVLFIVFLVLKLTGVIAWSWWWITAPLWGPVAIGLIMLIASMVVVVRQAKKNDRKYKN